jgi:hypothetical protein
MVTRYTVAAVGLAATLLAVTECAEADDRPAIVVHVDNIAFVPARTLSRAKGEVERVFRQAGVSVSWGNDPLSSAASAGTTQGDTPHLALLILNTPVPADAASQEAHGEVLGEAVHAIGRAYVFSNRVDRATASRPVDAQVVLGRVMAHELGHLLLPAGTGHTGGIMQAHMDLNQVGFFQFTAAQSATIRELLAPTVPRR